MSTIGSRIKEARLSAGLTGPELGRAINVTKSTVSNWENDKSEPSARSIMDIEDATGYSARYLVRGKGEKMANLVAEQAATHNVDLDGMSARDLLKVLETAFRSVQGGDK